MLYSTFNAGEGGARLSLDVVKEGLIARMVGSGVVGTLAPSLKRARASLAEVFVGIVGFLVAAMVLSHYVVRWRAFPTSTALDRTQRSVGPVLRSAQAAIRGSSISPAAAICPRKAVLARSEEIVEPRVLAPGLRGTGCIRPDHAYLARCRCDVPGNRPRCRARCWHHDSDETKAKPSVPSDYLARRGRWPLASPRDRLQIQSVSVRLLVGGSSRPSRQSMGMVIGGGLTPTASCHRARFSWRSVTALARRTRHSCVSMDGSLGRWRWRSPRRGTCLHAGLGDDSVVAGAGILVLESSRCIRHLTLLGLCGRRPHHGWRYWPRHWR